MSELAQAAPPACFQPAELAKHLAESYDEHPIGNGLADGGVVLILYASRDGSSWTLVIRHRQVSCITATGRDWSAIQVAPPKPPERGI